MNLLLPMMIFMNMRYATRNEVGDMLRHEAGHVLGLANRSTGAAGGHCQDPACLMYSTFPGPIGRFFSSRESLQPRQLCPQCHAQLAQALKSEPASGLRFVGPVLVREEAGYHVLAIANRVKVVIGELAEQDCEDFEAALRAETLVRGGGPGWRADCFAKPEALRDASKLAAILHQAETDPYGPVQKVIAATWANIIQAYRDHGEEANADILSSHRAAAQRED